jgi:hypothetical protein
MTPNLRDREIMQHQSIDSRSPRGIVILIGYASTISAVLGYDIVACGGVATGVASALMRLSFLVFVSASVLATVLLLFFCCSAIALAVGALPVFRERKELLLLVIPVASFLIGILAALSGEMAVRCALSPWP